MKKLTSITIGVVAVCALATSAVLAGKPTLQPGETPRSYCEKHAKDLRYYKSLCSTYRTLGRCVPAEKREQEIRSCMGKFR